MAGMADVVGAVIDRGASDWRIFQQNSSGTADIVVAGRWGAEKMVSVEVRLVHEDTSVPVAAHLNWQAARAGSDGTWSAVLKAVPAGGLYRLETHVRNEKNAPVVASQRGDMRHFLGVGDLWVIAGQSNSAGYGRGPAYDPPELGLHLFNNANRWTLATQPLNESTDTAHPRNREGANSGHGPWLHFARLIRRQVGIPIGLIQVSLGGSPLVSWNPTEPGDHPLYDLMLDAVKAVGGKVRGILWYQGCSDAGPEQASTYERRFIRAVRAWRKALKSPGLPVLTVQINRYFGPGDDNSILGWTILRDAQRLAARRIKNVTITPTLDLTLTDGIHISPGGNMLLGQRIAQAALAAVYGKKVDDRAPEPKSAKAADGRKTVVIAFENVTGRLDTIDPTAQPFRIEDSKGVVPIEKIQCAGASVHLFLGRPLSGKAVVHGAWGFNPPVVPCDMDRVMPMLGFYGLEVGG
jgi:hypothetical protein